MGPPASSLELPGVGLRIAVVDSGVHAAHPHVNGVAGGVGIDDHAAEHDDYVDRLGHGTAVTAAIREKAPGADVYAVKVFDRELSATAAALAGAIRWARRRHVHLINLSLGTLNADHEAAIEWEVNAALAEGLVIVAAGPQPGRRWLPGALPGVVRVELDMTRPRDTCAIEERDGQVTVRACGYPRPIPGVPPERNLRGLSFAVANATGLLARTWPAWPAALLRYRDRWPSRSRR